MNGRKGAGFNELLVRIGLLAGAFVACFHPGTRAQTQSTLAGVLYGFENPQDSARTKVWWFHGETETTREGITADLLAYKKAGVGGVIYYDQSHGKAENALPGFSADWWRMLRFAASEAKRIGLTFEVHISNGYVAGGPWITPEYGMKRLTATEVLVDGGKKFSGKLPVPGNKQGFSRDVVVLAFPALEGFEAGSNGQSPQVSTNSPGLDVAKIFQQQSGQLTRIPNAQGGVTITLSYPRPFTARSISYEVKPRGKATTSATNVPAPPGPIFVGTGYRVLPDIGELEASDDGINYRKVCTLKPIYQAHESWIQKTIAFAPHTARFYRLNLHDWAERNEQNPNLSMGSVSLNTAARIDSWEEKAGLYSEYIGEDKTPAYPASNAIDPKKVVDISRFMAADGTLNWNAPAGKWAVMRFAYVITGATTKHGRQNLIGRECDKLSVAAAQVHWDNYVGKIVDSLRASGSGHISGVAMDSHEAGSQNWTDNFIAEFKTRQGYDPTPFLPGMMGYVVKGVRESNAFLFDVRRNIADMISDNYYGTFDRLAKKRDLVFTAQAIGNALCIVGDPIQAKGKVSKPQGEFWAIHPDGNYDIKESASAAHLYGKQIASGEAYTDAKYSSSLADLKSLADYAYAFGLNEFVICASAYQPWLDRFPGSTGGGRHYSINRNNTYWAYSKPFWDFQARNSFILRGGKPAVDLCVYLGENAPVKILTHRLPDIPGGFDFDAFTTDALLNRMSAEKKGIVLPDGTGYRLMILPRNGELTFAALKKIAELVKAGARVYGPKPVFSPSLRDRERGADFARLANLLWGASTVASGARAYGNGRVYWGMPLADAIREAKISPDVSMDAGDTKRSKIYFTHRRLADADVYFIDNHKDAAETNVFTFHAGGQNVQLWNSVTGDRYALPLSRSTDSTVSVELQLAGRESVFVMVTNVQSVLPQRGLLGPAAREQKLDGPWNVFFDPKWGGPGDVQFSKLEDWTRNPDPAIKYYSGTAVYTKTIDVGRADEQVYLDLGNPGFVAQVFINAQEAGTVWCAPWQLDVSRFLRPGENKIEIRVANSLMNRMIFDSRPEVTQKITYSYPPIATPNDQLVPSGLTAVKLVFVKH